MTIFLTSTSTRRKALLQQIGFREQEDFLQADVPVNYDFHKDKQELSLAEVKQKVVEAARLKVTRADEARLLRIYHQLPQQTVIVGADTVVFFAGRVLDRPLLFNPSFATPDQLKQGKEEARRMLSALKGQVFHVVTGLVVAQGDNLQQERSCCVVTEAKMKEFSDNDIERYIQTGEPLDKAGGFGIQERGVILFEKIKGSYSNIVGLPLVAFVELLRDPLFAGRVHFRLHDADTVDNTPVTEGVPELRAVSVGDINYDLVYSKFPVGFFANLRPPGEHVQGQLYRGTGGTAAIFATRAREVGFKQCSVLGVIGGDALGKFIEQELHQKGIRTLLPADYNRLTGVTLVLRDQGEKDTLITLTDSHQALSEDDVNMARAEIEKAHVVFISGYCLSDPDRRNAALRVMELSQRAGGLVVLDVHVDMDKALDFQSFTAMAHNRVDVMVAEIATVFGWLNVEGRPEDDWAFVKEKIAPALQQQFSTVFLRTSSYSHEIIASPAGISGPHLLDYSQRRPEERLGYGDERTVQHLYEFMSPRLLLASKSPRRLELLRQIVADNKIEILVSKHQEERRPDEAPEARVKRLALEKAQRVLARRGEFSPSIEIVVGADTEIVVDGEAIGQPANDAEARQLLQRLSGRTHRALTGLALISATGEKAVIDCVCTHVKFKQLSSEEIDQYVMSGEPIGKAGAYGIQGKGALFIEEIAGSYSNVVGLPLERLSEILDREFGLPIWNIDRVSSWHFSHHGRRHHE
ncbi:MAG: Maf family nucleotide pyrophosphatase [Chloroflexi bacterium]|nr:Maf family nucleotide pyrophosphatase [Chloroflexota bacterium]MCI0580275.1 Maf family nucleotide pyrophosphatase [Chloroflexota bacterium]MCI0643686.1 Maf family nucleotide pyrophosphatase [Chloroflexota bacterium]MCI0729070.1 Maf family nucleotide pyrophosphatase [Chloroflexota bacterium]